MDGISGFVLVYVFSMVWTHGAAPDTIDDATHCNYGKKTQEGEEWQLEEPV
jgi:hypothetical protein